jgi:CelD/BcsL family acetyltransferase involved in cellulose biosynthesis
MRFETLDPARTDRWEELIGGQARSFFHNAAWAEVLRDTYGHRPCYIAGWEGNTLVALLPLMEVDSPLTGRRGVSLPFLDRCPPWLADPDLAPALFQEAIRVGKARAWKFLEVRGWKNPPAACEPSVSYTGHQLKLNVDPDALFEGLEPGMRRGIRKARKEGVEFEISTSLASLQEFYRLHCLTRGKHGVPPQPFAFFENIFRRVLANGLGMVVTASVARKAVAAAVFFHDGSNALYKYGASDPRRLELRGNNLVMWEAIQWYATRGYQALDFGRTSKDNEGLSRFKRGFGAEECRIDYWKYHLARAEFVPDQDRASGWVTHVFRWMPPSVLRLLGRLLYPHLS